MERAICELGIIPFFTCAIPGYSIKELTQPGFWFDGEEDSRTDEHPPRHNNALNHILICSKYLQK